MSKTILVTGASSGFGKAIAETFLERGWNVAAALRRPDPALYPASPNLQQVRLDVTDAGSIAAAVSEVTARFGRVDALVNNAGVGAMSAVEHTPDAVVREIFETNLFGTLAMTRAVIPLMRAQGEGVILNMTSSMALAPMPFMAIYASTKWAIEGLSEAMGYELAPMGIRVRLLEPGLAPDTNFGPSANTRAQGLTPAPYAAIAEASLGRMHSHYPTPLTTLAEVTEATFAAATDPGPRLRYRIGADTEQIWARRLALGDEAFIAEMRSTFVSGEPRL